MNIVRYSSYVTCVVTDDYSLSPTMSKIIGSVVCSEPLYHNHPEEVRVVGGYVLVCGVPLNSDFELLLQDGVCSTLGTYTNESCHIVREESNYVFLTDDGILRIDDQVYRNVHHFLTITNYHRCMVLCDGTIGLFDLFYPSTTESGYISITPPQASVFAGCVDSLLYSVSNSGELAFCNHRFKDWAECRVEEYGRVKEIGVLDPTRHEPLVIVIFNNRGAMQTRYLELEGDSNCVISGIIATGVCSIDTLNAPRYKTPRIKSAMNNT